MIQNGNILPNKLLTKPIPRVEKKTNSGIILPNQVVKDVNISATVVQIGSGVPKDIIIKEGDTVLFNPHAIQRLVLEDKEYGIVDYKDLLFIFTPESVA